MKHVMKRIRWTLRKPSKPLQLLLAASEYLIHLHHMIYVSVITPAGLLLKLKTMKKQV